jgi:HlyD family secretion protein
MAPETAARLASVAVSPGQHVRKGDLLAVIENRELAASIGEGSAAVASAKADRDRLYSGVQVEEVEIAALNLRSAEINLLLAQQQNVPAVALSYVTLAPLPNQGAIMPTAANLQPR